MIGHKSNSLCRQAELYYYDFLHEESRRRVPESILDHIEQCLHCQEQVNQLKEALSRAEDQIEPRQKQLRTTVTNILAMQLAYIGKPVTCQAVRPFLPILLDPAVEIRIPTPVTAHLDNCQQCREDLETIRELNLNHKQLCRLGQLLADKPAGVPADCAKARFAILPVALMDWSGLSTEVLEHLCKCSTCRDLIYKERQKICNSLPEYTKSPEFPCESVLSTDIFDYCFPYGIDPAKDEYEKFRTPFTSHVRNCRKCLIKMQQLHKTICAVVERPDSEVVTVYHIDKSIKAEELGEQDDIYAGFPIRVEVIGGDDEAKVETLAPAIDFSTGLRQKVTAINLKPLVKTAIAAAAVILIAVILLLNIPTAEAVTIDKIYKALEKVKNVYIASYVPDQTEPTQEIWVSPWSNIYMTKTGQHLVLWDIPKRVRKSKSTDTDSVEAIPLSAETITKIEKMIAGYLGLVPFTDLSTLPDDAEWNRVTDANIAAAAKDMEVYDLTWRRKAYDGSVGFRKWRVFVDPRTNLPQKTELYRKLTGDVEYTLISLKLVEYLTDSEMQAVIRDGSF